MHNLPLLQFAATESEASESGVAVLAIDPIQIALQATTFLILFFIIRKYAFDKIVKGLEDRRLTIEEGIKNAEEMQLQKEALQQENEKIAQAARKAADEVIGKSHEEAGAIVAEAQAKASRQADEIVAKAKAQAEQEKQRVRTELKAEIIGLVTEATEIVLDEKVDAPKDKELIERSVKGVQA